MMDSEAADVNNIVDSADVWIHHMHFARWRDGAIDMRGGAKNISVTWSRFEKIFQALNWTGSRLSFGYNYCSNVSRRCIQMIKGKGRPSRTPRTARRFSQRRTSGSLAASIR